MVIERKNMTIALCINCGKMKFGALLPCQECGCGSTGNSELDIAFTDHFLSEETLQGFGKVIQCLRKNTKDESVAFGAFIKHVSENYPAIILSETPRQYRTAVSALLEHTNLPEVMIVDSPRIGAGIDTSPEEKYTSRVRHYPIQCEFCGHVQSFAIWSQINGSFDAWINEMIVSGRLFMNKCRRCRYQQVVPYHTLYMNIEKPFAVWLRMPESRNEFKICVPSYDYFSELRTDFIFRAVSSPSELAEKIKIFLDGYDDILIEFIKTCLCFQRGIDLVQPLYYVKTTRKIFSGKSMTFMLLDPSGEYEIRYPFTSQKSKLAHIMKMIQPILCKLTTDWHTIDRDFVMQMLQNLGIITRLDI
ncbi:MAG: hypothetical protein C4527_00095 [Candidatus Omnitrophota bacterium]|jgi:hypothetical protein|nr:MAG: hypothetical protein C4527_00095 [Candidatus Omnitrophota bacterium]